MFFLHSRHRPKWAASHVSFTFSMRGLNTAQWSVTTAANMHAMPTMSTKMATLILVRLCMVPSRMDCLGFGTHSLSGNKNGAVEESCFFGGLNSLLESSSVLSGCGCHQRHSKSLKLSFFPFSYFLTSSYRACCPLRLQCTGICVCVCVCVSAVVWEEVSRACCPSFSSPRLLTCCCMDQGPPDYTPSCWLQSGDPICPNNQLTGMVGVWRIRHWVGW